MGGVGSGRHWYFGAKDTTAALRGIDIRRWKRDGLLKPPNAFRWQWICRGEITGVINVGVAEDGVILQYRHRSRGQDWKDEMYPVLFDWTDCHLGGKRPWFLCPTLGCGRRVAILYGGAMFACRHCHQLAYNSQRESELDRIARRANKLRDRLDWEPGFLNGWGPKPKGMHWRTYRRLVAEHDQYADAAMGGLRAMLAKSGESPGDWI